MALFRYSRWDGSQQLPDLDADDLLDALGDDLLESGDLARALRRLLQRGMPHPQGGQVPGLQQLLERLRRQRAQQLDRYDLGAAFEDFARQLDDVIRTEREGIERQLREGREARAQGRRTEDTQQAFETLGRTRNRQLDQLPPDVPGRIKALQQYDFVEPEARKKFEALMASLQQQMLRPFMAGMQQALRGLSPTDLARMREMIQDLNRMLRERAEGREPDFQAFKDKWGDRFPGVESLDDLLEQIGRQMAAMQSLLRSLSPQQRQQLQDAMRQVMLQDERLEAALSQLAMHLGDLMPFEDLVRRYDFRGDQELPLPEAMELMEELARMEQLERQLRGVQSPADLDRLSREEIERLLGQESARDLERLRELTRKLEEAGYLDAQGDRMALTARAIRKIADKALRDIFARLSRDRFGPHALDARGAGGDRTDDARRYEFGDPFLLDLRRTLMNGVRRGGAGVPVRLVPDDFEVFRTEQLTQAATVVLFDLSRSMIMNGCFLPAKKVTLALEALIRGQFPRDRLHVVGFSLYARELTGDQLPGLTWSDTNIGTNMHAAFLLARQLLARSKCGNKQIIMVTDGEPTAHLEGAEAAFAYPPMRRTVEETLKEARRCTREGITINTFMLERSPSLVAFVEQLTRINGGRAFLATPERLGEYVLVDYVRGRRRSVA